MKVANIKTATAVRKENTQRLIAVRLAFIDSCIANAPDSPTVRVLNTARAFLLMPRKARNYNKKLDDLNAVKRREMNVGTAGKAANMRCAWTQKDDELLFSSALSDYEIAVKIGRSMSACVQRRSVLRRRPETGEILEATA